MYKALILGVVVFLSAIILLSTSYKNKAENLKADGDKFILPKKDYAKFDPINKAKSIHDLDPYFHSEDIWVVRAAINKLGNLVSQELISKKELDDAWNGKGRFSNVKKKFIKSDMIRLKIAYSRLLFGEKNPMLLDYLYSLKNSKEHVVKYDLAQTFGEFGGNKAINILYNFAKGSDLSVAREAIRSLEQRRKFLHDKQAGEILEKLLKDKNVTNRGLLKR